MPKVNIGQLGSRMYYAVPRILDELGYLNLLFTDVTASKWPVKTLQYLPQQVLPSSLRKLAQRQVPGIHPEKIKQLPLLGMNFLWRIRKANTEEERQMLYLKWGEALCHLMLRQLDGVDTLVMIGSTNHLLFKEAKKRGIHTIKEQIIASPAIQLKIMESEWEKYPEWEDAETERKNLLFWQDVVDKDAIYTDAIWAGSCFVKDGIAELGGNVEKVHVIPYGVTLSDIPSGEKESPNNRKLRVLSSGAVSLRKGYPYVFEAARQLKKECEFRVMGTINAPNNVVQKAAEHIGFVGHLPRQEMMEHFQWADVFLLPSLCEGSATVTYEALNFGLPLIVTHNTGTFIHDGEEGFIVPIKDAGAIVEKLLLLKQRKELLKHLSDNATKSASFGSYAAYKERIADYFGNLGEAQR